MNVEALKAQNSMTHINQQQYTIATDYDVVVLRHALRQLARANGLSLVQQARITAAISDIAREVLHRHWCLIFKLTIGSVGMRHSLDVLCQRPSQHSQPLDAEFETKLSLSSARQLLDEASFSRATGQCVLTLRTWI
jgi:hypothetical protein